MFIAERRSVLRAPSVALLAILPTFVLTSCVPLPTAPTNASRGARLNQPTAEAGLPIPELDAFEVPETPALDEASIEIRTAGYDPDFAPRGGRDFTGGDFRGGDFSGFDAPDGITQSTMDAGIGARLEPRPLSLEGRVRLDRIGESDDRAEPSISVRALGAASDDRSRPSRRADQEFAFAARRDQLLTDLAVYAGRDERDLGDGERLAKHRVQMQLMALHFLRPDDRILLEPLVEALAHPHEPCRRHELLRASFYESIDLERESQAILASLGAHATLEPARPTAASFRISEPIPCTRISGLGQYRAVERSTFRPGTQLRLYVEIFGIANSTVGEQYRQRLKIEFSLVDRDGRARGSQTSRTEGAPTDTPVIDSFLNLRYSLPREVPFGDATLHLTVTDLVSGEVSRQQLPLQIEP